MNATLAWSNLTAYSLQVAVLVAAAAVVPVVARLRMPRGRLLYWQLLLAACLALPLVRPWRQMTVVADDIQMTSVVTGTAPAPAAPTGPSGIEMGLAVLAAGIAARLAWLGVGFWRLGRYRREAAVLEGGSAVPLLISNEITGPVTFGFRRPVILLPARFRTMPMAMQEAILCHERLHVKRRDWLFTVVEELVRAVLWFHPAIWWLLGQIQLAREQAVDQRVIEMTQARDPYVDALLEMAGARPQLDLAPAPLFLRKRHLKQRVSGIFKEARMSKKGLTAALAASLMTMAACCWLVTGAFPLAGAPQVGADGAGVTVELNGAQLLHRAPVGYPPAARARGVRGTVTAQVKINSKGEVSDASIVSGPEELRRAVLESVLAWHFMTGEAGTVRTVRVTFGAQEAPVTAGSGVGAVAPRVIIGIFLSGVSNDLLARLPVHVGDMTAPDTVAKLTATVKAYDPRLAVTATPDETGMLLIRIAPSDQAPAATAEPASRPGGNGAGTPTYAQRASFAGRAVKDIVIEGLSDDARVELLARLPVHVGETASEETPSQVNTAVAAFDPHLRAFFVVNMRDGTLSIRIAAPPNEAAPVAEDQPKKIRVGGNVQAYNLISQTRPVYPAEAKAARVQGKVELTAIIGPDGRVQDLKAVSGHPLLVPAALDAVKDWVYRPTLLNGNPITVETTIDINFTLSQ